VKTGGRAMKNSFSIRIIGIIAASILFAATSHAKVLLNDDFDSDKAGSFPTGWTLLYNGAGTSLQVVDKAHFVSAPNSLKLVGSQCWSADAYRTIAFPAPRPPAHLHVQVSGYIFVGERGTGGCTNVTAQFGLSNPSIGQWGWPYGGVIFGSDGFIYTTSAIVGSSAIGTKIGTYAINRWYNVSVDVDMTALTCEISVDNELLASGVPLPKTFAPHGINLGTGHGSNDPTIWYDNIVVRTPAVSE